MSARNRLYFDEVLKVHLRECPMYPGHLVSRCGKYVRNTRYGNITKVYRRNPAFRYLQSDGIRNHRLVASAWVYNPYPEAFGTVDHMDHDTQNNDASNLRWISKRLNCIHRKRKKYYERVRMRDGRVFYRSKVTSEGDTTRVYSRTKEEAEKKTKDLINGFFNKIYREVIQNAPPGRTRAPHLFLWDEPRESTPGRSPQADSDHERSHSIRTPRYSF